MAALATEAVAQSNNTIRYCYNDWPPYTMQTEGGYEINGSQKARSGGISVEVMTEASHRAGYEAVFVELPWKRCLQSVRNGELDAVLDAAPRDDFLQGPAYNSIYTNTFWVSDDSPIHSPDLAAIVARKPKALIGLVDGYVYPENLLAEIEAADLEIDYAVDDPANLHKLSQGRVNIVVADFVSTFYYNSVHHLSLRALQPAHSFDPLFPSFHPGRVKMQRRVNSALEEMTRDGSLDSIYQEAIGISFSGLGQDNP
ncbi:transporter substrate-binding domain-containing protein [Kiloniella laminariae]|uniref:Transporter substrate-binding domain-containing protein n=1 Tax=Kiloniella laminariae TaxID=454162 RepID=A0ABT4LF89_9PROT|nr:transporter substrate-binding domain-containing protein [Kiloniella laminariae]MCZ4279770.1 transporter substrate-binding domain-containing protein [Kiloniella laminariae]